MITLYGIKNCDKVRAARRWLEAHDIEYRFHELREDGLDAQLLTQWLKALGTDAVLNKRSTTWKSLDDKARSAAEDGSVVALLLDNPTLIKRPLLNTGREYHVGFSAAEYTSVFKHHTL